MAVTESRRSDDHPVVEMHPDFKWIGKNRPDGYGGGLGFMYNTKSISIIEEGILNITGPH